MSFIRLFELMEMKEAPFAPCLVRLGTVIYGGPTAQLHKYTRERNMKKLEKLLMKGVDVNCVNNLCQTPLFCACLLGFSNVVELLLQYGADPNHRCEDRSTPVHAAVFSCNPWLLSCLLDAGGDLRLHDDQGRTPKDWAKAGGQESSPKMLEFLRRCESHMWSLSQTPRATQVIPTSSKNFLKNSTVMDFLKSGDSNLHVNKSCLSKMVQCFGYGKLCIEKPEQLVGLSASVPLITNSELSQAKDEAQHSFTSGSFSRMTNYIWKGCWVTVKELQESARKMGYLDLFITELEYCCHLFHPHLLQLMAVCMSSDLQQHRLVYERVHVGSLYNVLHHRRSVFPILRVWELLTVVVQVCEALLYLHGRNLVLRSLSSHSVLIVYPGVSKVTDLGFMVPSEGCCLGNVHPLPVPVDLYNWSAPEVIMGRACTGKADIYSVGALIQELYTEAVPWDSMDPHLIKQAVQSGQALPVNPAVTQPYYQLLQNCLQPQAQDRTSSIHEIQYILYSHLIDIKGREMKKSEEFPHLADLYVPGLNLNVRHYKEAELSGEPHLGQQWSTEVSGGGTLNDEIKEQHVNISHHNLPFLDECGLPEKGRPHSETTSSEDLMSSSSSDKEGKQDSSSISEYIGSIILNLKVSQVLLQQIEGSLVKAELVTTMHSHDQPGSDRDEVDGLNRKSEDVVEVLNAVGPPSTYMPLLEHREAEGTAAGIDVSKYEFGTSDEEKTRWGSSSGEESNVESLYSSDISEDHSETAYKLLLPSQPVNAMWTRDVREIVGQMTHDKEFGTSAEDQNKGEETTDYHTISQTVSVPETRESDQMHSEDEDDVNISMGVCHALDSGALKPVFVEHHPVCEDQHHIAGECSTPMQGCLLPKRHIHDEANIAELSSIVCSPALHQECLVENITPPSPQSRCLTPCICTTHCQCKTKVEEDEELRSEVDSSASVHSSSLNYILTSDRISHGVPLTLVASGTEDGEMLNEKGKQCKEQSVAVQDKETFEKGLTAEEAKISEIQPDLVETVLESDEPIQIEERNLFFGPHDFLEETARAHSTLDEALQDIEVGDMEPHKPSGCLESTLEFCAAKKLEEEPGCTTGKSNMEVAGKEADIRTPFGSGNTKAHEEDVEATHTRPCRLVHRVIVLDTTE